MSELPHLPRRPSDRPSRSFCRSIGRLPFALLLTAFGASTIACADVGAEPDDELVTADESSLVGPHDYARPAKPTKSYPAPSTNAIWVATSGNDTSGNGSEAAPYKTIAKAVAIANAKPAGATWTVVIKAGTYREGGIVITRSNVTIQRNGTDAVAILGTVPLTGFAGSGPYTLTITSVDTAPLEVNCADTHLDKGASKVYGAEQPFSVIRAGVPLKRVASAASVASGQYHYDNATNKLTLRDSPTEVELVHKLWAFQTRASGVRLAGLDIEGYGTCAVDYRKAVNGTYYYSSAVQFFKDSISASNNVLEGSTVANNSGGGVVVAKSSGVIWRDNVLSNNGWDGGLGGDSPGLVIASNVVSYNNMRGWGNSVEAGIKLTMIDDGVIFGNVFEHNAANGFWCDQGCGSTNLSSNYFVIAQNVFRHNDNKGLFYEVSHHAMIASNLVHDNGSAGIALYGSRAVQVWNNTLVDNNSSTLGYVANLSIVDDTRCAEGDVLPGGKVCSAATSGVVPLPRTQYDNCEPQSDGPLANTCNSESIALVNNIISGSGGSRPLVNVQIPAKTYAGALAVTRSENQSYFRPAANAPSTLIEWQKDATGNPIAYGSLDAFRAAIGSRETGSIERVASGAHPFFVDYANKNFTPKTSNTDVWGRGTTLPLEVLKAVYWPQTSPAQPTKRIGAIAWVGSTNVTEPPPPVCDLSVPVRHLRNPTTGAELLTTSSTEVTSARAAGYTEDQGIEFAAATASGTSRIPVYRLLNNATKNRLYTTSTSERSTVLAAGWVDEGIGFYVRSGAGTCLSPVRRFQKSGLHTYSGSTSETATLIAAGWNDEGIKFYGGTP